MKFCVSELLQSRAFAAPFTALTLLYTLRHIQTPQTYIHFTQMHSDTSPRYLGTLQDNNRHQQTPTDTKKHQLTLPDTENGCSRIFGSLCWHQWRPLLSYVVCRCRRVSKKFLKGYLIAVYCFVQSLIAYKGVKGVLRPCVVYQMLYIGKAPRGKFSHTWQFWNIKIPKPPNLSSLKIIGFLHFLKFLGPLGKDYNLHSLIITLYLSKGTQMCL